MGDNSDHPGIYLTSWDLVGHTLTFHRSDGKEAVLDAPVPSVSEPGRVTRIEWSNLLGGIIAHVDTGASVAFEMPLFDGTDQLNGRLTVYLDQNHWSTLAKARHQPQRVVDEAERDAAAQLEDWVQNRKIVLPMSAGHHVETTQHGDETSRFEIALTMLQLSRGWQMRAPVTVRGNEIYEALRAAYETSAPVRVAPVFTLEPYVTSTNALATSPSDLPLDYEQTRKALEGAHVTIEVLLDREQIERADLVLWVEAQQQFSDWLGNLLSERKEVRSRHADLHLLQDFSQEIADAASAAGVTHDQLQAWITKFTTTMSPATPSLNVYRLIQRQRHMTAGITWKRNDLLDMTHLACAAACADFVVAERHQTTMLNQALRSLGRKQNVSRSLRDAIPLIRAALDGR